MSTIKEYIWNGSGYVELDAGTVDGRDSLEFETADPEIQNHIKTPHASVATVNSNRADIDAIKNSGYLKSEDVINTLVSTEIAKPLSANQGKILKGLIDDNTSAIGQNTSDLNAHELDNVRHINKIPFQCTPNTGFQINYQDSYKIGNLILLQVVISMADGTDMPSSGFILFFPHVPTLPYVRVLSVGLDVNEDSSYTVAGTLCAHNNGIYISSIAAGVRTVSVSCVYTTY